MKKVIILLAVIIVAVVLKNLKLQRTEMPSPLPTEETASEYDGRQLPSGELFEASLDGIDYLVYTIKIPNTASLRLVPNFDEKDSGVTLINKYGCTQAINGGFYTQDAKPLGLFVSEGKRYGYPLVSNLVTGFFWEDKTGDRALSFHAPEYIDNLRFVLQTGPLYLVSNPNVTIIADEPKRRSLFIASDKNELWMAAVVTKDNEYSGPLLASLPRLFATAAIQEKLKVTTILNLDGGSASFFYSRDSQRSFVLSEITPIGSLFCLKQ